MWLRRLKYLPEQHKWMIAGGVLLTMLGLVWYIGAMASPTVTGYARLHGATAPRPAPASAQTPSPASALAVPPQIFEALSPAEAEAANARTPVSTLPMTPAKPFRLASADPMDRARALTCLTMAVYYEAATQGPDGEAAVAQVVLNRVRNPLFPKSVCGVVFQGSTLPTGCQFTFTCDGSLGRRPSQAGWKQAAQVAERALGGYVQNAVGEATHYHTVWVVPYWQPTLVKLTRVGAHIFYRWPGGLGMPGAFQGQYAGAEIAPPAIKGFDTGLAPAELAKLDDALADAAPADVAVIAAPAAVVAPVQPVQIALLDVGSPASVAASITPPKPRGYFGRAEGDAQHLPVPAHW
jgi:spore germination cell wall hydrolase CwlJ-like protein